VKQSPKLPPEKRRAQLIKAAGRVFARRGFEAATTEDIAREAGLTKGALYFHFKNKEDIFFAVIRDHIDNQIKKIYAILDEKADFERIVEKSIRSSFAMMKKEKYFTIDFWRRAARVPRIRSYLARIHREAAEKFGGLILRHSRLKKKEAVSLVWMTHALQNGLLAQAQCYRDKKIQEEIIDQFIGMFKLFLKKGK
jgi:AcrR family transcriptional regulator